MFLKPHTTKELIDISETQEKNSDKFKSNISIIQDKKMSKVIRKQM